MENLKKEFEKDIWQSYVDTKKAGYNPTIFRQMLEKYGAVETAKKLLSPRNPIPYGLKRLNELNILYLSVEELVLQDKYKGLFTKPELEIAKWRLDNIDEAI